MADTTDAPKPGSITWRDLTVPNAEQVRDFYRDVVGWTAQDHDMGDYQDYSMVAPGTGEVVAGVCHARGTNANVPPQWLIYINVEDVERSAQLAAQRGGQVVDGPRMMGDGLFAVIRDPAGAVCAIYQPSARKSGGRARGDQQ